MRFSVVVPIYNVERYLPDCLDSLIKQTSHDFEVILVDDGSTDDSAKICCEYAKTSPGLFTYVYQDNQGLLSARMKGASIAKGDYIVALDSDDALHQDALLKIGEVIKQTEAALVCFGMTRYSDFRMDPSWVYAGRKDGAISKSDVKQVLCGSSLMNSVCGKAIERNMLLECYAKLKEGLADVCLNMGEDLLQTMYLVDHARCIASLNLCLYFYRMNQGSITRKYKRSNATDSNLVYGRLLDYAIKWDYETGSGEKLACLASGTSICAFGALAQSAAESLSYRDARIEMESIHEMPSLKRAMSYSSRADSSHRLDKKIIANCLIEQHYLLLYMLARVKKVARSFKK